MEKDEEIERALSPKMDLWRYSVLCARLMWYEDKFKASKHPIPPIVRQPYWDIQEQLQDMEMEMTR